MMMKQNRALIFLFVFSAIIVGVIAWRSGQFFEHKDPVVSETPVLAQESMGDLLPTGLDKTDKGESAISAEDLKNFSDRVKLLAECFEIKSALPEKFTPNAEAFLSYLKAEWGEYESSDLWMNWQFKTKDGSERRLRLEVSEDDAGVRGRDLHLFAVDQEGTPIPLELDSTVSHNPSDEVISGILKEGEVFLNEKTSLAIFTQGESLQFSEKNGALDTIEIHKNEKSFHCESAKVSKDTCVCN